MGGLVFILVFRRECVPNTAVYFKAISPITQPYRSLVSLHMYDTRHSLFGFLPVPCVHWCEFGNMALHSDRLLSVIGYFFLLLRLLISIRPDTLIFLTGERISVFFGAFCALLLCWYLLTVMIPPLAFCFQMLLLWLRSQPDKQRKLFNAEKVRFPTTSLTSYVSFFSLGNLC